MQTRLNPKNQQLLRFIADYTEAHGWAPSRREMRDSCEMSNLSLVNYHLTQLERDGLIRWQFGQARALALTEEGRRWL